MASSIGPKLPVDGLVFMVDAGNPASYPGTGSQWFDIGGTKHFMDLGTQVTYSSNFGGVLQFIANGSSYARITDAYVNLATSNNTVITWSRKTVDNNNGRVVTAYQNNWLLGHHDTSYGDYYAQGWVYNISGSSRPSDTVWRQYTGTGDIGSDVWKLYINKDEITSNAGGSQGPRGFNVNAQYNQASLAEVAMIACWNRVLTPAEIGDVHDQYRTRFSV